MVRFVGAGGGVVCLGGSLLLGISLKSVPGAGVLIGWSRVDGFGDPGGIVVAGIFFLVTSGIYIVYVQADLCE